MTPSNQTVSESGVQADADNKLLRPQTEVQQEIIGTEAQPENRLVSERPAGSSERTKLIEQYGCGPVRFTGTSDALYERHLVFDNVMDATAIGERERFEAVAHSGFTTCRWNFSSVVRWLTTSLTFFSTTLPRTLFAKRSSIGMSCWSRSPTPAWAMEGSGA